MKNTFRFTVVYLMILVVSLAQGETQDLRRLLIHALTTAVGLLLTDIFFALFFTKKPVA